MPTRTRSQQITHSAKSAFAWAAALLASACGNATSPAPPCEPACRPGFVCLRGTCVSACNPACAMGERCTSAGTCERETPVDAATDDVPQDSPTTLPDGETPDTLVPEDASIDVRSDVPMDSRTDATDANAIDVSMDVVGSDGGGALARPHSPLSGSQTTTRRPTFRWVNAAGSTSARVELCEDRACSMVIATIDGTDRAQPTAELRPGWVFWRVRARVGAALSDPSPTWQVLIPTRETMVDRSYGTVLDVNGDGLRDLAIGAFGAPAGAIQVAGNVLIFHGAVGGVAVAATTTLVGRESREFFGYTVGAIGDVNGDGFVDLGVGSRVDARGTIGALSVFLGGLTGVATTPLVRIEGINSNELFGASIHALGDVNGDGYADFGVMSSVGSAAMPSVFSVFYGGAGAPDRARSTALLGTTATDRFGLYAESLGDVNGDGYGDIVVGWEPRNVSRASVPVFFGSAAGIVTTPSIALEHPSGDARSDFGGGVAVGDLNGDGYCDVVVGCAGERRLYVFHGTSSSVSTRPTATLMQPSTVSVQRVGEEIAVVGDINRDGFDDLVVPGGNAVTPYFGNMLPQLQEGMSVRSSDTTFAERLGGRGDLNGDGFADILVGGTSFSRGSMNNVGAAHIIHGTAFGPSSTVTRRIEGAMALDRLGSSVH